MCAGWIWTIIHVLVEGFGDVIPEPQGLVLHWTHQCQQDKVNGFKLKEGGFKLGIRKNGFAVRVVRRWNSFPEWWQMPHPWKR